MKKITIKDVAEAAGVSYVTVSNVINGKGKMTEKTRAKVLSMIKKMDFHPDGNARALVSGKSNTIAFVSGYLSSLFVNGILAGLERQLYETGNSDYILAHISTKVSQEIKQKLIDEIIYGKKADAVIMLTVKPDNGQIKELKKNRIPLVLIESDSVPGANCIRIDNCKGGYLAADYLLKKGKRKMAMVIGPQRMSGKAETENPAMRERLKGYINAFKDYGVEPDEGGIYRIKTHTPEEGARILDVIMAEKPDTDAIFCAAGDMAAIGILSRAKQLGISIPGDISLVGYDDIIIARFMNPALTTVNQQLDVLGKKAIGLALDTLKGKITGTHEILIMPELVIRESA
jgi:DNA-binding LacI/PurR family transcriptional regulator